MFVSLKTAAVAAAVGLTALAWAPLGHAGTRLSATRIVYNAQDAEATIAVDNTGDRPSLVQAWITEGENDAPPEQAKVPFVMTPPMFRLDGGASQALRIRHVGQTAGSAEKLYWLNVYEIPSRADAAQDGLIEFATRTRIKLFVRPAALEGKPQDAAQQLNWRRVSSEGKTWLEVTNPTAYHVNFSLIELDAGGKRYGRSAQEGRGGMVGPASTVRFALPGAPATGSARVAAKVISDHGGSQDQHWPLGS